MQPHFTAEGMEVGILAGIRETVSKGFETGRHLEAHLDHRAKLAYSTSQDTKCCLVQ